MDSIPEKKQTNLAPHPMVSTPLRDNRSAAPASSLRNFFSGVAARFPQLKKELIIAEMPLSPAEFVEQCALRALLLGLLLSAVSLAAVFSGESAGHLPGALLTLFFGLPLFVVISFFFNLYQPHVRILRRGRKIDQELVFAGRHLLIELRSGVVLFDAMLGVSRDYGEVSKEFNLIVEKITLGVPVAVAMHDVAEHSPSAYLRRVVLQMANAMSSGSDVADSLEVVLDQISQEQIIQLKAYGQKLNPLVMFFMLFGVIIPSLGVAFLILLMSVLGGKISFSGSGLLLGVFLLVSIVQFMFLSIVENSRPSFDLT